MKKITTILGSGAMLLMVLVAWKKSSDRGLRQLETVLRLRYVDGMSHEDIAVQLEIPKSSVKTLLEKARDRLSDLRER